MFLTVTATNRVLSFRSSVIIEVGKSPVAGSNFAQRTTAPTASAACTQGRTFES